MVKIAVPQGLVWFALILVTACSGSSEPTERQHADDWRAEISSIKYGSTASEEDPIALRRIELAAEFLSQAAGVPVRVYQTSDYNGTVQALSAGQLQMASMGAGAYSNVDSQIGGLADPILAERNSYGQTGYYSTMIVRADSPYQSIEDLKGKTLAYVDFNSTSGYIYPRWKMDEQGINPDTFFGEAAMAGKSTQAVLALSNGQFDATIVNAHSGTPETGFSMGTIKRMARQGLIDEDEFRIVWTAGPIPRSPRVVRTDLPTEFQDLIRGALAAMPYDAPQAYAKMARLPGSHYRPVDRRFYEEIIEMRTKEIERHRRRAIGGEG